MTYSMVLLVDMLAQPQHRLSINKLMKLEFLSVHADLSF